MANWFIHLVSLLSLLHTRVRAHAHTRICISKLHLVEKVEGKSVRLLFKGYMYKLQTFLNQELYFLNSC